MTPCPPGRCSRHIAGPSPASDDEVPATPVSQQKRRPDGAHGQLGGGTRLCYGSPLRSFSLQDAVPASPLAPGGTGASRPAHGLDAHHLQPGSRLAPSRFALAARSSLATHMGKGPPGRPAQPRTEGPMRVPRGNPFSRQNSLVAPRDFHGHYGQDDEEAVEDHTAAGPSGRVALTVSAEERGARSFGCKYRTHGCLVTQDQASNPILAPEGGSAPGYRGGCSSLADASPAAQQLGRTRRRMPAAVRWHRDGRGMGRCTVQQMALTWPCACCRPRAHP
jgi:hypothetical protein